MFGSSDAYRSVPQPGSNKRQDTRLQNQQSAYEEAKAKAESQGYFVQGDNKFIRVPDESSPNGFRLINKGKIDVAKYDGLSEPKTKSFLPSTKTKPSVLRTGNVNKPTNYPTEAKLETIKPSRSYASAGTREETTRENINGVEQKGTVLSPITPVGRMEGANEALRKLGVTTVGYGKFQSNHLPGSNYSPEVEEALSKIYDSETLHMFNGDPNNIQLSEDLFIDRSGVKGEGSFYADDIKYDDTNSIDMTYGEGSPFLVRNGDSPITSIVESQKKLGTRARYDEEFLNSGNNPMAGLKAAEASKGLLYASGGYYRENPKYGQKGEKDYLKIEKDDFKAIKNSDMNAQDFFASKLAEIKDE